MKLFLSILLFFWLPLAHSTITLQSISGASSYKEENSATIIYGGTAGDVGGCSGSETCNNCAAAAAACNPQRITSATELELTFKSDSVSGYPTIADKDGVRIEYDGNVLQQGESFTLSVTWGEICNALTSAGSSCETDFSGTVTLGVNDIISSDLNGTDDDYMSFTIAVRRNVDDQLAGCASVEANDGLCSFVMAPGDGKAYIVEENLQHGSLFPSTLVTDLDYERIRLYYSTSSFSDITAATPTYEDIEIGSDSSGVFLKSNSVSGLANGLTYYFRAASIDEAGNIGYFTILDTAEQTVVPEEVVGLLSEENQCFVATAAFGDPWAPPLKAFRQFRDQILKTSPVGQAFVDVYYKIGPLLAAELDQRPYLKTPVRWVLWGFWGFCMMVLQVPPLLFVVIISFLLAAAGLTGFRRRLFKTQQFPQDF